MAERWRVAVVGPGGVGGLIGALLTRAGHDVRYVARPETAAILNAAGMSVTSARFGDFATPAPTVDRLDEPVDLVVVAVKATSLDSALTRVPKVGDALVLPLLNGVDHLAALRRVYPPDRVLAGAVRVESARTAPGRIAHTSPFARIDIASALAPPDRLAALADLLDAAGPATTVRADEAGVLWDKLAFLAPFALLTTHEGAPVGQVRDRRGAELADLVSEVTAVARAHGATTDATAVLEMFAGLAPAMKSSMQRDVEAGRPTELDAIGGAVLRAGAATGLPTPVTARLVAALGPGGERSTADPAAR